METHTKALLRTVSNMETESGRKSQLLKFKKGTVMKEIISWTGKTVGATSSGKAEIVTEVAMLTMNVKASERCVGQMVLSTEVVGIRESNMVQV